MVGKEEILEGNKLISEFMGARLSERNGELAVFMYDEAPFPEYFRVTSYNKYHESWDKLMPVIEKIYEWFNIESDSHFVELMESADQEDDVLRIIDLRVVSKIEEVWGATLLFIRWYNSQSQTIISNE